MKLDAIFEVMSQTGSLRLEEFECELLRRSGRKIFVNLVASPLVLFRRKTILLSIHDLTASKRLQVERENNLKEISQISKLADIGMLAAGVAHELNNPLMVIQGFAENLEILLDRGAIDTAELRRHAKQIQSATERMSRIIRQMSRIVRTGDVQFSSVNMADVVQGVLQFLEHRIKKSRVRISLELPRDCVVKCDQSKVEQVLLNILSNAMHALEACPENDRQVRIDCTHGNWVDLKVWNNGPVVPKAIQEKIMTPFFTTKEVGKGTGLGLPVSIGIMKAHGGSLRFESSKIKGTTFTLRFPTVAPKAIEKDGGETDHLILLVNSDAGCLERQAEQAGRLNFQTVKVQSAMEAYQWLQGNCPLKAVFIHLEQDNPDGILLIQHIRQALDQDVRIFAFEQAPLEFSLRRRLQNLKVRLLKTDSSLETFSSALSTLTEPKKKRSALK